MSTTRDVANQPHGPVPMSLWPVIALAVDRLLAEREEGKGADDEAGASPGIPMRETKQSSPASHQASPMKTPPSTNQSRLNKKRKKDMSVTPDINWLSP
jgi:hypothetical protein